MGILRQSTTAIPIIAHTATTPPIASPVKLTTQAINSIDVLTTPAKKIGPQSFLYNLGLLDYTCSALVGCAASPTLYYLHATLL